MPAVIFLTAGIHYLQQMLYFVCIAKSNNRVQSLNTRSNRGMERIEMQGVVA